MIKNWVTLGSIYIVLIYYYKLSKSKLLLSINIFISFAAVGFGLLFFVHYFYPNIHPELLKLIPIAVSFLGLVISGMFYAVTQEQLLKSGIKTDRQQLGKLFEINKNNIILWGFIILINLMAAILDKTSG